MVLFFSTPPSLSHSYADVVGLLVFGLNDGLMSDIDGVSSFRMFFSEMGIHVRNRSSLFGVFFHKAPKTLTSPLCFGLWNDGAFYGLFEFPSLLSFWLVFSSPRTNDGLVFSSPGILVHNMFSYFFPFWYIVSAHTHMSW